LFSHGTPSSSIPRNPDQLASESHIAVRAHGTGEGEGLGVVHNPRSIVGLGRCVSSEGLLSSCPHVLGGCSVEKVKGLH